MSYFYLPYSYFIYSVLQTLRWSSWFSFCHCNLFGCPLCCNNFYCLSSCVVIYGLRRFICLFVYLFLIPDFLLFELPPIIFNAFKISSSSVLSSSFLSIVFHILSLLLPIILQKLLLFVMYSSAWSFPSCFQLSIFAFWLLPIFYIFFLFLYNFSRLCFRGWFSHCNFKGFPHFFQTRFYFYSGFLL